MACLDGLHGLPQLGHILLAEGVEGSLDGGLVGAALPAEGLLQRRVGAHPDVGLVDGLAAR